MDTCHICGEYDEDLHPVDFKYSEDIPEELRKYLGLGDYLDDLDAEEATDEFWENCAYICNDCFTKYWNWIVWWG
jgi:hypothetical protein